MIGVKLTVLFMVISLMMWIVLRLMANGMSVGEALNYRLNGVIPEKMLMLSKILTVLLALSGIGVVYSMVYLLFLR